MVDEPLSQRTYHANSRCAVCTRHGAIREGAIVRANTFHACGHEYTDRLPGES